MKKILALVLCVVFVFSFAACKEKSNDENALYSVDIERYVNSGRIDTLEYKLGSDVDEVKDKLSESVGEEGESNFFEIETNKYTVMSAGEIYCCYITDESDKGLTHIATCEGAYGFKKGDLTIQVSQAMESLGYKATERNAVQGELFFLPGVGTNATVLEYNFEENTLLFVFQESALSFILLRK